MMRSMYSAVTGLRTHQGKLDTIGNNIANVNTVGFKKGQVTFKEVFNQTVRGASSATKSNIGGLNPQQVGMGVSTGSINTIHTRGAGQRTDNPTDLAIEGDGFFMVSDDVNGNNRYYTRAGNFNLDNEGNLVTADGLRVLGYEADYNGKLGSILKPLRINASETKAPIRSNKIELRGNLDSRVALDKAWTADTMIRDSLGNAYNLTFEFKKSAAYAQNNQEWEVRLLRMTDVATKQYTDFGGASTPPFDPLKMTFDEATGKLKQINGAAIGEVKLKLDRATISFDKLDGQPVTPGTETNILGEIGGGDGLAAGELSIIDSKKPETYEKLTQFANDTTIKPYAQNGSTSGTLRGFSIGADGVIVGAFDNGDNKVLGQVSLAKFDNSTGLEKIANNLYKDSRNSGEAQLGKAGTAGFGSIASGTLEMSNVDLALEFTEMITTQRGFQANSRVITTSDEMLQELVNIKR